LGHESYRQIINGRLTNDGNFGGEENHRSSLVGEEHNKLGEGRPGGQQWYGKGAFQQENTWCGTSEFRKSKRTHLYGGKRPHLLREFVGGLANEIRGGLEQKGQGGSG